MTLNYIWIGFFFSALLVALVRVIGYTLGVHTDLLPGFNFTPADRDVFVAMVESTFEMAKISVNIAIGLIGVMALWLGIMRVVKRAAPWPR